MNTLMLVAKDQDGLFSAISVAGAEIMLTDGQNCPLEPYRLTIKKEGNSVDLSLTPDDLAILSKYFLVSEMLQ